MRFNNIERLRLWRDRGQFPSIHDGIANVIVSHMRGTAALDLCCGFGLLGQRIIEAGVATAVSGIDCDAAVIEQAQAASIQVSLTAMKVGRDNANEVASLIRACKLSAMFARRCLPELFGNDLPFGVEFAAMVSAAGIREIFLEGRVKMPGAVNALSDVSKEVELLSASYREVKRVGQISYMVAR